MDTLSVTAVMTAPADWRVEAAATCINVIKDIASEQSPDCGVTGSDADQVVVRAGVLDVFFRVVHALTRSTFVEYGYFCRTPAGGVVACRVGEFSVEIAADQPEIAERAVRQRFYGAIADVANAVADRYGQQARIRNGEALE